MARNRKVKRPARFGGTPCDVTSESVACGSGACDVPCTLQSWTPWGKCSKACDGGWKRRYRHVARRAKGQGACPRKTSRYRVQFRGCNRKKCETMFTLVKRKTPGVLQCNSMLDVVILLDGSGSIGSKGWAATKNMAKVLVKSFTAGANTSQLAVLLFSGPRTSKDMRKCHAGGAVDMEKTCNIKWVSHWTTKTDDLANSIGSLSWPRATTLTSVALANAGEELVSGRRDAKSIVIVVTDGRPNFKSKTESMAKTIRKKARLAWVPVTRYAPISSIKKWASTPVSSNVLVVKDFKELEKHRTINELIADVCPSVQ